MKNFELYRIFKIDFDDSDSFNPTKDLDFGLNGSRHYSRALFIYEDGAEFVFDPSSPHADLFKEFNNSIKKSAKGAENSKGIDFWRNFILRSYVNDYESPVWEPEVEPDFEYALEEEENLLKLSLEEKKLWDEGMKKYTYPAQNTTVEKENNG
jgi:hypothetical protein